MRKLTLPLALIAALLLAAPAATGKTRRVNVDDNFFKPAKVKVKKGKKVVFRWTGTNPHNVALWKPRRSTRKTPTKRSVVQTSGKFTYKFRRKGTWRVICEIHPSTMRMKVRVR